MDVDDIETIAVLGAGNMGHGIAEVAAIAGFEVRLRDIEEALVEEGIENIEWSLDKLTEKGQLSEAEADAAASRIEGVVDLGAAVGDADVVVEAVPERMDVKREVYGELSAAAPEEAVFATNTSSLSITELSEATDRPERFCGMHFFNPPVRMELVEVIAGEHTAPETADLAAALAEAMGKTPVRVRKDSPGFVVNRVLIPLLNEAAYLVETGAATRETVEATVRYDLGLPMGALELADQVGVDVVLDVLEYLHAELGDAYEPCPAFRRLVEDGDLGRKSGAGFYDYDDGGPEPAPDATDGGVADLLVAVMADEVADLVAADVADADAVDRAMQLGAGFPEGPARMADDRGVETLVSCLRSRHEETGAARHAPGDAFAAMAADGKRFHAGADGDGGFETLDVSVDGAVGRVVIDRAHAMNTVTPGTLDELERALTELEADDAVRALLLTGAGDRAFSAGADVSTVVTGVDPVEAVELSRRGQRVFGRFEESDLPVVAGIDGYCLGGGMELATCADLRVASPGAVFGQVEHDLGLLPGWGGTQRLPHVVGEGRAREIIMTADRYDAETMADYGFVNEVAEDAEGRALELARDLAAGPPIAQRYTKRALLAGREDTDAGLELEATAFGQLLTTADLDEGLAAFDADRDPEFEGR